MKTRAKRIAAILMAAVMTVAIAVPAFADDATTAAPQASGTSMQFDKVLDADTNTYHPNETFKFEVTNATATENEKFQNIAVFTGINADQITVGNVTTNAAKTGKNDNDPYKGTIDVSNLTGFTNAGVYKYTVKEKKGTNQDITYDETEKTLYVYVKWTDETMTNTEVYGMVLANGTSKNATFTNEYKHSPNSDAFKDLIVKKKVAGAQGDKTKLFHFTLKINSGSGRTTYVVSTTANGSAATLTSGQPYEFDLKDGESIKIENLSTSDTYTIDETDYSADGYVTGGEVEDAKNMSGDGDVTETITNTKDSVTPTGIVMSYGPYMLMIAAAAVLAFVFLRKREEI